MNALTLLKEDHQGMKKLLDQGEDTTERAVQKRRDLLERITTEFSAHEKIEEDIFYPALKEHPKAKDIVLEGYQEHHVADILIRELHETDVTDERWGAKFKVLKEGIEHHIEEEEGDMFKKARSVFSPAELNDLGDRMQALKQQVLTK
jgi:hemerythrin-like domain-containing protein